MTILQSGVIPSTGGYQIERSLRFNSADSAYLNRTPASASNRKTWTWSGWVKRSALGAQQSLFTADNQSGFESARIHFLSGDTLSFQDYQGTQYVATTTAVFRDPSAWYHIVVALDTTQATAANRLFIYVNGVSQAYAWGTTIAQNTDGVINTTKPHFVGRRVTTSGGVGDYYNGYMTEINFIDGLALDPSYFGFNDSNTGVWTPRQYTGAYGTNGFYLNFSDNSGTTSTTLGKDYSGNGNNWTPNNFSVTAGAGNDSLVDTPTSYGTDTGAGGEVRGNYCTLNPLSKSSSSGTTPTNGNLDIAATATACDYMTTMFVSSGKWYFEVLVNQVDTSTPSSNPSLGIQGQGFPASGPKVAVDTSGALTVDGSTTGSSFYTYTTGDLISVAFDMDAKKAWFAKNGTYYNSGAPAAGTNATGTWSAAGEVAAYIRTRGNASASFNAGQRPFAYTAPSGFKALCTQNLPTPTIGATSTTQANDYFNAVLYTGTGSSLGVTGVGFQPDWTWIKGRSGATDHGLYDAVRGVQKQLESNTTTAETTETTGLTAFNSDGFTVGALAQLNTSSATYVAWNWKANGAGSSNTAGTITSTVSANTTSGFSIATFTTTGVAATIGHGLGVAPRMVIMKDRTNAASWLVYHASLASAANYLVLNATDASASNTTVWNNTAPTSTVFSIGTVWAASNYVAYCFAPVAGYSAFGSYTGNGSADGPFVFTNFRPAFVLIKNSSTTYSWNIFDYKRSNNFNYVDARLYPDLANAEQSAVEFLDFTSNGFKIRASSPSVNNSTNTFIYAAFAENPFKYSLAR